MTVFTAKGAPIVLGRELGRGGEGSVFEVPEPAQRVAKLYHRTPEPTKQAKLRFMALTVDTRLLDYAAWPQETLHASRSGPVVGFLMSKVAGKAPVHMVYSPAHRRHEYPKAAWDFLLHVARNIAASFDTVHSHGHVIGDVNERSVMVGSDSKVVLIDCDSFQINAPGTRYECGVGVPLFTPPELQSSSFTGLVRTTNHDNFGLALLIFHVLFGGRHPFSGVPLRSGVGEALETNIKEFRYAYARDGLTRDIKPPPRSIPVSMLPDSLEAMFHLAFTEMGASAVRPSAQQWVAALDGLRARLKRCGVSSMHIYPGHLGACPWCELEKHGVIYFVDLGSTFTQTPNGFVLTRVWALIQAVPAPPPLNVPSPAGFAVEARSLPKGVPSRGTVMFYKLAAVAIAIGIVVTLPAAWFIALLVGWIGWGLASNAGSAKRAAERSSRCTALEVARQEYERLVERAKQEAGPEGFQTRKAELVKLRGELESLPTAEKKEIDSLHATAHERQKQKFLDSCYIDSASIPGVGPARKAALRSFGIETAADVTKSRVMQVRGFGHSLTKAVLDWKASCERRFIFNPSAAVSRSDRDAVRKRYAARRASIERVLAAAPAELQRFRHSANVSLVSLQPQLEGAARKLAQAQADLSAL